MPSRALIEQVRAFASASLLRKLDNKNAICGWFDSYRDGHVIWYEPPLIVRVSWMFWTLSETYRFGCENTLLRPECDGHALLFEAEYLERAMKSYCDFSEPNPFEFVRAKLRSPINDKTITAVFDKARKRGSAHRLDRILPPQKELQSLRKQIAISKTEDELFFVWHNSSLRVRQRIIAAAEHGIFVGWRPQKDAVIAAIDSLGTGKRGRKEKPELDGLVRYIVETHELISPRRRRWTPSQERRTNEKDGPLIRLFEALGKRFHVRDLPDSKKWKRIDEVPEVSEHGRFLVTRELQLGRGDCYPRD